MIELDKEYLVISVIGPHAGESVHEIFDRKILDVRNVGKTFWLIKSHQSKPNMVQKLCQEAKSESVHALFIEASTATGAMPTQSSAQAEYYSKDCYSWEKFPSGLSPVTGKIDSQAYALVFNRIELINDVIDLWNYASFVDQERPIKIQQGASTLCAVMKDMSHHPDKMKSHNRRSVAIGYLCEPYCVWLR